MGSSFNSSNGNQLSYCKKILIIIRIILHGWKEKIGLNVSS